MLMKSITTLAVAVAVAVVPVAAQATPEKDLPKAQTSAKVSARKVLSTFVAPLVRPDSKRVSVRVLRCHSLGRWQSCRATVRGKTRCNAIVRVRQDRAGTIYGWVPRMRCR